VFPKNKGLRDKIRLDLYFSENIRDKRSDSMPLAVRPPAPDCAGSVKNQSSTPLFSVIEGSEKAIRGGEWDLIKISLELVLYPKSDPMYLSSNSTNTT
jgi:hypothetical protein